MAHVHHGGTRALGAAFGLNLAFTVVEAVGGWWTNSAAVLSDAVHDLGDCLVLGAAWYLTRLARRGRDARYSYGYGRYRMLGGWAAALVLIVGSVIMLAVGTYRLWRPEPVDATGMLWLAVFGVVMNGLAAALLHGGHSLNERGVYLHLLEDVLGWVAVLVGALVIRATGWVWVDPLLTIGISLFIGWNAVRTLSQGTRILMQAQPERYDEQAVRSALLAVPGVSGVHDQHAWTLDGRYLVLTVHLVVNAADALRRAKDMAREQLTALGVDHATIEVELEGEDCTLQHH